MMGFIFQILFYLCLFSGVQCFNHIIYLKCKLSHQESFKNDKGQTEVRVVQRDAVLLFGQRAQAPINTDAVIFLVNVTDLDLRLYLEDKDADHRECELHHHNTYGLLVPLHGPQDYNYWYNCTIKHRLFTVSSILRQPVPNLAKELFPTFPVLKNGNFYPTTVSWIMKSSTPRVKTGLGYQTKLDCQFVFDHKGVGYTVEWFSVIEKETKQLFSYNSLSGSTQGTGVDVKALLTGDASYNLPAADRVGKGTFICSLSANPLVTRLNIDWTIEEQPKVSINVGSILLLSENSPKMPITCTAADFYPESVEILWTQVKSAGLNHLGRGPVPAALSKNIRVVGSQHNGTLSMFSNLDLHPLAKDSGTQFTCSVFHESLSAPIRRSFIIYVEEQATLTPFFFLFFITVILSALMFLIHNPRSARRWMFRRKPTDWFCCPEKRQASSK